jgi:hypothetical protein
MKFLPSENNFSRNMIVCIVSLHLNTFILFSTFTLLDTLTLHSICSNTLDSTMNGRDECARLLYDLLSKQMSAKWIKLIRIAPVLITPTRNKHDIP